MVHLSFLVLLWSRHPFLLCLHRALLNSKCLNPRKWTCYSVQCFGVFLHSLHQSVHLLSQAAREDALLTFTSVAVASVWIPAWCATASPTVLTVQMRAWDVPYATAPAPQLLSVTTTVSAPQMAQSVHNRCLCSCW